MKARLIRLVIYGLALIGLLAYWFNDEAELPGSSNGGNPVAKAAEANGGPAGVQGPLSPLARRFLPPEGNHRLVLVRRDPADLFEASGLNGSAVEILGDGTLWAIRKRIRWDQLPGGLLEPIQTLGISKTSTVDHLWLMAYELETSSEHSPLQLERFVDPLGVEILRIVKKPSRVDGLVDPPEAVRHRVDEIRAGQPVTRWQRELEWGLDVVSATWDVEGGKEEVKTLPDGRVLFWEATGAQRVPSAVAQQTSDSSPEPLLLEAYRFSNGGGVRILHSTGQEISHRGWTDGAI